MGRRPELDAEGAPRVDVKSEVARRIIDAMKDVRRAMEASLGTGAALLPCKSSDWPWHTGG